MAEYLAHLFVAQKIMSHALRAPREIDEIPPEPPGALATREHSLPFALPQASSRLRGFLFLFVLWVILKNTWLCEDAFITFRVVDNFVSGLGLRWNPLERVQTFTHPLWMLCVSVLYFPTRDIYFAGTALSLVCSATVLWLLLFKGLRSLPQCLLATALAASSKAFVDFSTSGLENPLSNLLLVLFFIEYLSPTEERSFTKLVWFAGLAITNRMDLIWLLFPALVHLTLSHGYWRPRHYRKWAGLLPFVTWEVFSIFYYGFPFPNTAYAKLTPQVSWRSLVIQGDCYLLNSLSWDPITLFAMAALVGTAVWAFRKDRAILMLAAGVALHIAYTIKIGGDYMSGRFLAVPFVVSLLVLSRVEFDSALEFVIMMAAVLALGIYSPRPPIQTSDQYVGLGSSPQGVDDERGYRHNDTSLLKLNREQGVKDLGGWVADGVKARREQTPVSVYRNIGYYGFFAGPGVHIIDPYGIGDPLMARMPFPPEKQPWQAGHFMRKVPEGYTDAAIDRGDIANPELAAYWAKLKLVTRGPIFDDERLKEVLRFNLGLNPIPASVTP
jgi:arabinofuranosyltransferase